MPDGFGDVSIFLKFRAFSAPEEAGDYFVGFFLAGEFPSGSLPNGMGHTIWSPMLAAAKGWSWFDVQSTLNGSLPQSGTPVLGRQILFNNTFQFKLFDGKLWPEVGPHSGNAETFLTPGLLIGPFKLARRLHFEPGVGTRSPPHTFICTTTAGFGPCGFLSDPRRFSQSHPAPLPALASPRKTLYRK
jgi:hypothetical protein